MDQVTEQQRINNPSPTMDRDSTTALRMVEGFLSDDFYRFQYTANLPYAGQIAETYFRKHFNTPSHRGLQQGLQKVTRHANRAATTFLTSSGHLGHYLRSLQQFDFKAVEQPFRLDHLREIRQAMEYPTYQTSLSCNTEHKAVSRGNRKMYDYIYSILTAANKAAEQDPAGLVTYMRRSGSGSVFKNKESLFLENIIHNFEEICSSDLAADFFSNSCHQMMLMTLLGARLAGQIELLQSDDDIGRAAEIWAQHWAAATQDNK